MFKTISTLLLASTMALTVTAVFACPFGENSAYMKHDDVTATLQSKPVAKPDEAMSTFDPADKELFEKSIEATTTQPVEISE